MERIRRIRGVDERHQFTLVCRDLSEIGTFAKVDNTQYRLLKANTPGAYTFILMATRELPRRLAHPKRATIGVRVPDHAVASALLAELGEPILSSTLVLPDADEPLNDAEAIRDALEHQLDVILNGGACGIEPTTIVDLSQDVPILVRRGKGMLPCLASRIEPCSINIMLRRYTLRTAYLTQNRNTPNWFAN